MIILAFFTRPRRILIHLVLPVMVVCGMLPISATAQVAVKGMIVVYDGRSIRSNSRAYEYSALALQGDTFTATLSNGQKVSGLASQLIAHVNYAKPDKEALIRDMDAVAARFKYAAPTLSVRRNQILLKPDEEMKLAASVETQADRTASGSSGESREGQIPSILTLMETAMSPMEKDLPLLAELANESDWERAKWGIRGLGKLGSQEALSKLSALFTEPETTPIAKREMVKQFARIAKSGAPEHSTPCLGLLKNIIDSPEENTSVKDTAIMELASCAHHGNESLTANVKKLGVAQVEAILAKHAEAARKAKELADAFTPEDRAKLMLYCLGPKNTGFDTRGDLSKLHFSGRLQNVVTELESREASNRGELVIGGYAYFERVDQCDTHEMIRRLKKEKAELVSGDPYRIAMSALLRVNQLIAVTDFSTRKSTAGPVGIDIHGRPYSLVVQTDFWGSIQNDGAQLGEFLGSQMRGVFMAMDQARMNDIIKAAEMLASLSPSAKARIGIPKK